MLLFGVSVVLFGVSVVLFGVSVVLFGVSVVLFGVSVVLFGVCLVFVWCLFGVSVVLFGVSVLLFGDSVMHEFHMTLQVFGFYEELLSSRFPHSSYKLVFVDGLSSLSSSYSTLGLFDTNLLHSPRIIDQVMVTRRVIGEAIAKQYFGCYVAPQVW